MRALVAARALVAGRPDLAGHGAVVSRTRAFRVALVICALGAGLAIRFWVLSTHLGEIDQDEAVMGLMARHVLDGEFSVFFWGQAYGGAQEAVLTAALFAVGGPVRQVLGVAAVAALCVAGLRQINVSDPVTAPASLDPLFAALDENRVDRLFTPYVIAHRIVFDSDERIVAAPIEYIRHPPLELMVRARPTPAYLFARGSPLQAQFEAELARLGVAAEKTDVGTFDLYQPSGRVLPEDWWHDTRGLPFMEKAAGAPARRR